MISNKLLLLIWTEKLTYETILTSNHIPGIDTMVKKCNLPGRSKYEPDEDRWSCKRSPDILA